MRSFRYQYVVLEAEQFPCEKQRLISWACPMSSAANSVEFTGSTVDCTRVSQMKPFNIFYLLSWTMGFGGLGMACWPLVPKFVGSNPAEAVGFLGRKNSQHALLRRGIKDLS